MQEHQDESSAFHVTIAARGNHAWCCEPGVPQILIDVLIGLRYEFGVTLHAFVILPDHVRLLFRPGSSGLDAAMAYFLHTSLHDVQTFYALMERLSSAPTHTPTGWQPYESERVLVHSTDFLACKRDIESAAVQAHLVAEAREWPWSSLHYARLLQAKNGSS